MVSFLDGVISLYNSLSSTTLSAELAEQLARIYGHLKGSVEDGGLTVHHIPVQKQKGVSDCGPFAIALLIMLCWEMICKQSLLIRIS